MVPVLRSGLFAAVLMLNPWAFPGPAEALVGASSDGASLSAYVVMVLERAGARVGFCSGVVMARDAVLTAAHCVPAGADIRVHFRDEAGQPVLLPVNAVVRHPGYRADAVKTRQRSIDLALIRLNSPLPERFRPARLDAAGGSTPLGTSFRIAGFGVTREGEGASSGTLRMGVIAARAPRSALLLWAQDPQKRGLGACEGDSGGPIFAAATDTLVAVTLWAAGAGASLCGALTQALWIAPQQAWIAGILQDWGD